MPYQDIEETRMYERAERVADEVWEVVLTWKPFERDTVGKQLARAADSIGANLAESSGRFHPRDVIRFVYYARGSLKETPTGCAAPSAARSSPRPDSTTGWTNSPNWPRR